MRVVSCLFTLIAVTVAFPLLAQPPAFDPRSWKGAHAGPPTQILTLGSAHLAQLSKPVTPQMLVPLLDKLAAFKPEIITVEGIAGEQCDVLKRYAPLYAGAFETYCWDTDDAEKATGLTLSAALGAIEKTLETWPPEPIASQRRHLAAMFLAANDRASAQVQWRQLPAAERIASDGIDAALLKILTRGATTPNESYSIAVELAARLGLQRVYAVDDHTSDSVQALADPGLEPFLQKHWTSPPPPIMAKARRHEITMASGADLLDYYRFTNDPATLRAYVSFDYKRAMQTPSIKNHGRVYVAWWEVRNLRMVANIRAAFGNKPGARVLNIVGASHKAYYDAYLDLMSDVKLVDAEAVLR